MSDELNAVTQTLGKIRLAFSQQLMSYCRRLDAAQQQLHSHRSKSNSVKTHIEIKQLILRNKHAWTGQQSNIVPTLGICYKRTMFDWA